MTLWQFSAAIAGWNRSQGGDDNLPPPTADQARRLLRKAK